MKNDTLNKNRKPRLEFPFTKWMSDNGHTSEGFRDLAVKKGLKLNLSTILKWRIGTMPRAATRATLARKFIGITFE